MDQPTPLQRWQLAERHWAARQREAAETEYQTLLADPDWVLPASLRLGAIAMGRGDVRGAVQHALEAFGAREPDAVLLEAICKLLLDVGELRAALACVDAPAIAACTDPAVLMGLGGMMSAQGLPDRSLPLLRRARQCGATGPELPYLLGNDEAYAGNLAAARREYEECLRFAPDFAPAHRGLAKLERATADRNHLPRLRQAANRLAESHSDAPLLYYALFKELDDTGQVEAAWQALATGMRLRHGQVQHDVEAEAEMFAGLMRVRADAGAPAGQAGAAASTNGGVARTPSASAGNGPAPVFIVGLPRSGTTLLERLLGAHPDIADAGELRDAIAQLRWCTNTMGPAALDAELVQAAEGKLDPAEFGQRYLQHTQWHAGGKPLYTDKMPANFLLLGYLARALPHARFLHLVREPIEVCFSNLKELFGEAYPHSYDQVEMGTHFRHYHALMRHWHAQFPGRILDVRYHELATTPEPVARAVLAHLGLAWDAGVLSPETRGGTVATASSAQVREPIHTRFIGQWRRYEAHLGPLKQTLGNLA